MKQFLLLFVIPFTVFSGCSSHFERYTLSAEKEAATTSYKNVRLLNSDNKSKTIVSTIYLNDVYPRYADGFAHFLVSFYNPENDNIIYFDRTEMPDKDAYIVLLNGENALISEELDSDDLLVELMPISNSWNRYYYVRYRLPSVKPVLVLESDRIAKAVIIYQIEQE